LAGEHGGDRNASEQEVAMRHATRGTGYRARVFVTLVLIVIGLGAGAQGLVAALAS
jgi:hypothetical protein